jgi:hypothetical protein
MLERLEQLVADDPYDEAAWLVLEDYLLQHDDPRAEIYRAADQDAERSACIASLLGAEHARLLAALPEQAWRGAFLRECRFAPEVLHVLLLELLLDAPATRLMRSLTVTTAGSQRALLIRLGESPLARCLHHVGFELVDGTRPDGTPFRPRTPVVIEDAMFAAFARLRRLALRGPCLHTSEPSSLAGLRELELVPRDEKRDDFASALCRRDWPELEVLRVDVCGLDRADGIVHELASSLTDRIPRLRRLAVRGLDLSGARDAIACLAATSTAAQLEELDLGPERADPASLHDRFPSLARLSLIAS